MLQQSLYITACDPHILKAFPSTVRLPFVLLHRSGVTLEVYHMIYNMACQGSSFADIETFFLWRSQERYSEALLEYMTSQNQLHELSTQCEIYPVKYLSNDLIMNLFIIMYNTVKDFLFEEMISLTAEYLSCDHTFKLPKHIGLMRRKSWVPQYYSLFIMQNEKGEILFWQLTSGTAYAAVSDGLNSLKHRISSVQQAVKMVIIDNSCAWRRKLLNTFGEHVDVKLDLFHAVKRVTSKLSEKHPHFYHCVQDWRLVFRCKGDCVRERKKSTPSPECLKANLQLFVQKWSTITSEGQTSIISSAVSKEINRIQNHMQLGCLSNIPPNFGTSRNENLHRLINYRLAGHHIGVELAVALLSVFFHTWNAKRNRKANISVCASYDRSTVSNISSKHHLGIGISAERYYLEKELGTAFNGTHDTKTVVEQIQEVSNNPQPLFEHLEERSPCTFDAIIGILHYAASCEMLEDTIDSLSDAHPQSQD